MTAKIDEKKYMEALNYRPETIKKLFPDSKALIVSGKVIHAAMLRKRNRGTNCMTIAANGRNEWVIEGALRAAARTNSAIIIEIAKSETTYCPVNFYNIAKLVNDICEKHNLRVVVAVHADHYTIKKNEDIEKARAEFPKMIEAGITSIAIDASHMKPEENVFANIELARIIPSWVSIETEVGEIKGKEGLSTPEEAEYHVKALNAYGVFPTWIALNNGSVHGIEATGGNIDVDLTARIHEAIQKYGVYGAQHGTSGNNYTKLRDIVKRTNTTKANVATALQMLSWGLKVNEYGNAEMDRDKNFIKLPDQGVTEEAWRHMMEIAAKNGWKGGDIKKLNREVDAELKKLPADIQARMVKNVEEFVVNLLDNVFYATDTANYALEIIHEARSHEIKLFDKIIEDKNIWTREYIIENGKKLFEKQTLVQGRFDD